MTDPSLANFKQWKPFVYSELFKVVKGKRLTKADMTAGDTPFIGASDAHNGVTAYISAKPDHPGNLITVSYNGSVAEAFYQSEPFSATDDINVLYPNFEIDEYSGLFISAVIRREKYRFNYGRKWHKERMEQSTILLPVDDSGQVDTKGMRTYMLSLNGNETITKVITDAQRPVSTTSLSLDLSTWKNFDITRLFKVSGTTTTTVMDLENHGVGEYPYVTTQTSNNGVDGYYNFSTEAGQVLTVDSAVLGYCSYQSKDFAASDHVEKLSPLFPMNQYIALFLTTIMNKEQYRYNYGRKASQERLKKAQIKLPATKDNQPDWLFMENYIKSLPFSSNI